MTKAQQRIVDRIRRDAEHECPPGTDREIKRFDVTEHEHFVEVLATVGYMQDEGTMAECLCRYSVQVFIGPRGGTQCPISKRLKSGSYRHGYVPYTSFLGVHLAQK